MKLELELSKSEVKNIAFMIRSLASDNLQKTVEKMSDEKLVLAAFKNNKIRFKGDLLWFRPYKISHLR